MLLLFSPILADAIWIGGRSIGLIFVIIIALVVLGRQPLSHSAEDLARPNDRH
jgi:hypothetical protein